MIPILSKSQETKYRQKCKDLKRRIQEIEDFNEATALNLARTKRAIIRVRLERELLMEKLEELAKSGDGLGSDSTDDEVEIGLTELQRALLLRANDPPPVSASSSTSSSRPVSSNNIKASQAGTAAALAAIASVQGKGSSSYDDNNNTAETNGDGSESPKKRAVRNPDMPKRPQNAYIIFCEREKEGVRASMELEADGETFDLTRALADSWKELGQEGRQPYYKLYQEDRRRYLEEMSEYVPENPSEAEQKEIQRATKALEELRSGKGGDDEEEGEGKAEEKVEGKTEEKSDKIEKKEDKTDKTESTESKTDKTESAESKTDSEPKTESNEPTEPKSEPAESKESPTTEPESKSEPAESKTESKTESVKESAPTEDVEMTEAEPEKKDTTEATATEASTTAPAPESAS
ncbi:Non-histone protein 10 [Yarrowia sp. C11]|nr:Non-histone protein 10 [Yarrowia sp. E02]KAG5367579.1 Non-histone protein 10 [Yarrowia sp. C11]